MLARFVETKAREMSNLVSNVLDLMRFESGHMVLRSDWQTVDDLAGTALNHLESKLAGHPLDVRALQDLPPRCRSTPLSSCKFRRAQGGEIEAHRREGGGARFEFTLPAEEPEPSA
jgi:K+-sensing histidine kinase KdpD